MALDPSAEQTMHLASHLLASRDIIAHQREVIWALVTALRASQAAQRELTTCSIAAG